MFHGYFHINQETDFYAGYIDIRQSWNLRYTLS